MVKQPKIKARRPIQPHNVTSSFGGTAGDIAGPVPVTEEGNKYRKNVKGYDDSLQEKLPRIHKLLRHKNRVTSGRMKIRYNLRNNSIGSRQEIWYRFVTSEEGMVVA